MCPPSQEAAREALRAKTLLASARRAEVELAFDERQSVALAALEELEGCAATCASEGERPECYMRWGLTALADECRRRRLSTNLASHSDAVKAYATALLEDDERRVAKLRKKRCEDEAAPQAAVSPEEQAIIAERRRAAETQQREREEQLKKERKALKQDKAEQRDAAEADKARERFNLDTHTHTHQSRVAHCLVFPPRFGVCCIGLNRLLASTGRRRPLLF